MTTTAARRKRIAVIAAVVAVAAGCGDDANDAAPGPDTTAATTTRLDERLRADLPRRVTRAFLANCAKGGGVKRRAVCNCIIVRLAKRATPKEIASLSETGQTPPLAAQRKLETASKYCAGQR